MLKRIAIYISCALLILIGTHVWAQQDTAVISLDIESTQPFGIIEATVLPATWILPWPNDGVKYTEDIGFFGRTLIVRAGYQATAQLSCAVSTLVNGASVEPGEDYLCIEVELLESDLYMKDNFRHPTTMPSATIDGPSFTGTKSMTYNFAFINSLPVEGFYTGTFTWTLTSL